MPFGSQGPVSYTHLSLLAMVISLFETGYLRTGAGLFESSPGHLSSHDGVAVRIADAMRRCLLYTSFCAARRGAVASL